MKHFVFILLGFIAVEVNCFQMPDAQLDSIPKFRGFDWRSSIETVQSIELAKYQQTYIGFGSFILSYRGRLIGYEARIDYVFEDSSLVEALYEVKVNSFDQTYKDIKNYYSNLLGFPNYWATSHPDLSIDWGDEEDNGICRGPEMYWEYCNGFIGIIAEKYKEEITISVLYVHQKTIEDYGKLVTFPYTVNSTKLE